MTISQTYKKTIADEFKYAAKKMREEEGMFRKNFFFSATMGIVFRVLNFEFDSSLIFIHSVLQDAYNAIQGRLVAITSGQDKAVVIPEELFDRLADCLVELAIKIEKNKEFNDILQKISNIAYVTTGNGYYLYEKGILKF